MPAVTADGEKEGINDQNDRGTLITVTTLGMR